MKIDELSVKNAAIRDTDFLVIEDEEGTKKITIGNLKDYLLATAMIPAIDIKANTIIDALNELKVPVTKFEFAELIMTYDIPGLICINFKHPESITTPCRVVITRTDTAVEIFRTYSESLTNIHKVFYSLRDYSTISQLSESDKIASGLTFDGKQYVYRIEDKTNTFISNIENTSDTIISVGVPLLIEIDIPYSFYYLMRDYVITAGDVLHVIN